MSIVGVGDLKFVKFVRFVVPIFLSINECRKRAPNPIRIWIWISSPDEGKL